jgi:enamine deaminase RidA (YjgF/YER057c/UK114 family)
MSVAERLAELRLVLPGEMRLPPGVEIPFQWARVCGNRVFISGHGALAADGSPAGPFGRVPSEVSLAQAQQSARLATLAMLGSLSRSLGSLDLVSCWLMVSGFVNADPDYAQTTLVINPCSDLLLSLYGQERGAHARTAMGVSATPLNLPVVIAAEAEIAA